MRKLWDKYHRGIVATGIAVGGGFDPAVNVYQHLTQILTSAGLGWSSVIPVITGAVPGVGPYAAVIAAVYYTMTKGKQTDVEKLIAELKERGEI